MNLGELRQAVRDDLDAGIDGGTVDPFFSDAVLTRYVNRSYKHVRSRIMQLGEGIFEREASMTYSGGREVAFRDMGVDPPPLRIISMGDVTNSTDAPTHLDHIDYFDEQWITNRSNVSSNTASNRKMAYFLSASEGGLMTMGIRPIPSGSITLRMKYIPSAGELVNDHQIPDVPVDFHEAIVFYAVYLGKMREEAPAREVVEMFENAMRNAIWSLDSRHEDVHPMVRVLDATDYEFSY